MATDWKDNDCVDLDTTLNNATLSHNFSNFVFGSHLIAAVLYSLSVLTVSTKNYEGVDISMRPLILKMTIPFRSDTQLMYGITLVIQFFYLVICTMGVSMLNVLLIVLVSKLKLF